MSISNSDRTRLPEYWREGLELMQAMVPSLIQSRADIMAKYGTTFGGDRKHYEIFGWPVYAEFETYKHLYRRGGIAKRLIKAYPYATWRTAPEVKEQGKPKDKKEDTVFEQAWKNLVDRRKVFHYLERVDRMARLGRYSVLFIGYADGADYERLKEPVGALRGGQPWEKVLYLQPYDESKVQVTAWEEDPTNERFGLPKIYQIQLDLPGRNGVGSGRTIQVHYTRVLHVAEDLLEYDTEGDPALEPVLNYLLDLEKTHGSAAESFYQQNPPGMVLTADKDANLSTDALADEDFQTRVNDFVHGMKRWLGLMGIKVEKIVPDMGDPTPVKEMLLDLIAGAEGIPKRILVGSERGELASSQDETAWNKRIEERQKNWAEPFVLRLLIDELIGKGVLPAPAKGYDVEWFEVQALGETEIAEISEKKSNSIAKYAGTAGTDEVVPPDVFLTEIMGFSPETVGRIKESRQELWDKETEDMLKTEEELAQEELSRRAILGEDQPLQPDSQFPQG